MNVFWHCSTVKTVVGSAIITVVDDAKVDSLLDALHKMDKETEQLGLRAFVWNVEKTI